MNTSHFKIFTIASVLLALQGCASPTPSVDSQIDQQVATQPAIKDRAALRAEATHLIENAPGLSQEQRSQLTQLKLTTKAKIDQQTEESLKLRSLLIQNLMAKDYSAKEAVALKEKITNIESDKTKTLLNSIDKANKILGRDVASREVLREFAIPMERNIE